MTAVLPAVGPGIGWEIHRPRHGRPAAVAYIGDVEIPGTRLHGPLLHWRIALHSRRLNRYTPRTAQQEAGTR